MENWFENDDIFGNSMGEKLTQMYKEDGFTSKKEYDAFSFVDSIIGNHVMELGIPKSMIEKSLYIRDIIPTKKEDKIKFYEELGLTYVLEKALTSTEEELIEFRNEFEMKLMENLSSEELEKRIKDYEYLVDHLHSNMRMLQQKLEEKKKKSL